MNWINVKKKEFLPESFMEEVLFTDGSSVYKGYRMESMLEDVDTWYSNDFNISGVTHWMPLPDPPKE